MREQIQAFEDAQDAIQRQGRAYQELQDPLGEYLKNLAALNAVLAQHPELAGQAAGAQDKLRLAFLDTQNTLDAGIERGLIRLAERFGDFASIAEEAVTDAFVGLEDQFVNLLRGRETDFGGIFDNLLDQAAQIGARAILGPITQSVTEAFTQGITGAAEGAGVGGIFDGFLGSLGSLFTSEDGGGGFLSGLGSIFQSGASLLGNIFNSLFSGLASIFSGEGGFLGGLGSIFTDVLSGFGDLLGITGSGGFLGGLGSVITEGAAAIGSALGIGAGTAGAGLGGLGLAAGGGSAAAATTAATSAATSAAGAATSAAASAASVAAAVLPFAVVALPLLAPETTAEAFREIHSLISGIFGGSNNVSFEDLPAFKQLGILITQETQNVIDSGRLSLGEVQDLRDASFAEFKRLQETGDQTSAELGRILSILAEASERFAVVIPNITAGAEAVAQNIQRAFDAAREEREFVGFATGGRVYGPGSGTSDSILARLSDGEFVVNAMATQRHLALLHAVNDNRPLPRFQRGGPVVAFQTGGQVSAPSAARGGLTVNVINNRPGNAIRVEEGIGDDGERELRVIVDEEVEEAIEDGRLDRAIGRRFGLRARAS